MFNCFLLILYQYLIQDANAESIVINQVDFNGPKRGPEIMVEGGDHGLQTGKHAQMAQEHYAEKINYLQEDVAMRWPLGIVPYYFDLTSYDYLMNSRMREAMDMIESSSCVRFSPTIIKPDNYSWLHITNPEKIRDCTHDPVYRGNEIVVTLGLDCLQRKQMMHTLLHGIGFRDEVTHPQRDQYIRIMWDNIQPRYKSLFHLHAEEGPSKSLVEYDPMSIMHFHDRAYSRNGYATIASLVPGLQIQPSDELSHLDKMKLRLLFGHECNRRTVDDLLDTCKKELGDSGNRPAINGDYSEGQREEDRPDYNQPQTESTHEHDDITGSGGPGGESNEVYASDDFDPVEEAENSRQKLKQNKTAKLPPGVVENQIREEAEKAAELNDMIENHPENVRQLTEKVAQDDQTAQKLTDLISGTRKKNAGPPPYFSYKEARRVNNVNYANSN